MKEAAQKEHMVAVATPSLNVPPLVIGAIISTAIPKTDGTAAETQDSTNHTLAVQDRVPAKCPHPHRKIVLPKLQLTVIPPQLTQIKLQQQ